MTLFDCLLHSTVYHYHMSIMHLDQACRMMGIYPPHCLTWVKNFLKLLMQNLDMNINVKCKVKKKKEKF